MADWYSIGTEFTAKPDTAGEAACQSELSSLDIDWPGFGGGSWRNSYLEDSVLAEILVKYGYRGKIWIAMDPLGIGVDRDRPPIILDPERAWDEEIKKEKAAMKECALGLLMKAYREAHDTLGVPVASVLNKRLFLLLGGWEGLVEDAQARLTRED